MTKFTDDERAEWITFCKNVEEEFEIERNDYTTMSDEELDKLSDWYFELTLK